jgi:hypothetical protein
VPRARIGKACWTTPLSRKSVRQACATTFPEETSLVLLYAGREVPPDSGLNLPVVAIARDVGHLGPGADRVRFVSLDLPGRLGESENLGAELFRHVCADGVSHLLVIAPAEDRGLVQGADGVQSELRNPFQGRTLARSPPGPRPPTAARPRRGAA